MAPRTVRITAKSFEELAELQERVIGLAKGEHVDVICHQRLDPPRNSKCLCGSGRKWKNCCMWEADTTVTFFHNGPPQQRSTRSGAKASLWAALAWAGLRSFGGV